jgi:hydrogenase maturation factor
MSKENGSGSKATFDFSGVSRRWAMDYLDTQARVTEIQQELSSIDEEQQAEGLALIREMQKCAMTQNELVARVLVSVPETWLTSDAPDDFDPNNPDHLLDYIRQDAPLMEAVNEARQEEPKK